MKLARGLSLLLLSLSALMGLVRGYHMATYQESDTPLPFQYPSELIDAYGLSNYHVLGWLFFFLVGVVSIAVLACIARNHRNYAYCIIVESVFVMFFVFLHLLLYGFSTIHFVLLPLCVAILLAGILQAPKNFTE